MLSRLHFKIHYEHLASEQRLTLWKSVLGVVKGVDEGKLKKIATDHEVNGHEVGRIIPQMLCKTGEAANSQLAKIKNAVSCAKLIAQSRRIILTADLLKEVLDELSPRSNIINDILGLPATFHKVSCNKKETEVQRQDGPNHQIEALKSRILDNGRSFDANQALRLATPDQVARANQALGSLADKVTLVYSGSGDLNIQFGNGDMFHVNSGGTVNKAEQMSAGHMPTSTR